MNVWVIYQDMGYDGYSTPLGVFSTQEAAEAWCEKRNNTERIKSTREFFEYESFEVDNCEDDY